MPISVVCWGCEKKLKVKEEAAGKKVRCPGCSEVIFVPKPAEPELDELEEFDDDFEVRKSKKKRKRSLDDDLDFDDGEDNFGDELPVRSKSSGKSSKKAKGKTRAKSTRGPSQGFLIEFYEGRLNQIMTYAFWGIFTVTWLLAPFGKVPMGIFLGTMFTIISIRGLITLCWWAKLCAANSSLGPFIYIAFWMFPVIGLLYGVTNNDLCEKPNRMFMFTIGIAAMSFVAALIALGISINVVGIQV